MRCLLLVVALATMLPGTLAGQSGLGLGAGLTMAPHSGESNCLGKRSTPVAPHAEVRIATTIGKVDVGVRGAKLFGLKETKSVDCFFPDGSDVLFYDYDNKKLDLSLDASAWYNLEGSFKVGGEIGVLLGVSKYIGAGLRLGKGVLNAEMLGHIHHVPFTTRRVQVQAGGLPVVIATDDSGDILPGVSFRILVVGP